MAATEDREPNRRPHSLLERASEVDTDDPLLAELRGYVPLDDAEAEARADTLVERLRRTIPSFQTLPDTPAPMPEKLEYFRVEKELGRGGMGTVYLALDTRLNRHVAVKILRPELAREPRYTERFLREARAAAVVDHLNVVPIHYVGEADGVPFLAMPLLKGDSLESWLKKQSQPPTIQTCLQIVRQIAVGLAAFHQQGMIHRDLKPSNIWLEPSADTGELRVKILDFGLARVMGSEQLLTERGAILGTPSYMAPEQARGAVVDQRVDLFSLGCVLYQLLTLKRAFSGPDTLATLMSLAVDQPKAPVQLNQNCPKALSQLTMELLAKEPADRPADVQQVIGRLTTIEHDLARTRVQNLQPTTRRLVRVGLLLLATLLAAGTYYVVTDKGTIIIQTDDPTTKVILEDDGGKITILDPASKQSWRINSGTYKVRVDANEREIDLPSTFKMKRGERLLATIRTVGQPPKDKTGDSATDRLTAKKMLLLGGAVTVEGSGKSHIVEKLADLPAGPLRLFEVNFFGNKAVKDSDLEALKAAPDLWNVNLSHTTISDAGLKHLVGLPKLYSLSLDGSLVTNAGLPTLKACAELKALGLSFSKVTEEGLVQVKEMTQLEGLGLCGLGLTDAGLAQLHPLKKLQSLGLDLCPITDDGLEHLKVFTNLTNLGLVTTKVTTDAAKKLAHSLPKCRITLDDDVVIEPTSPPNDSAKPKAK